MSQQQQQQQTFCATCAVWWPLVCLRHWADDHGHPFNPDLYRRGGPHYTPEQSLDVVANRPVAAWTAFGRGQKKKKEKKEKKEKRKALG
ncbi:hypothetical protein EG328_004258 [Venturia inaequalis]|uniref:Uncharacterized protein n=1 Tax=Venturia inaequalis TaxID=5025 RepID=A0A8H3VIQ5_VENIN|nr:hypothetical protein EG328_004258 [Venturia inaequalis]KAE9989864.1 hypothetical protein EG327_002166 [Venturia inaequalis]RDI87504.1 hypothetical protein Vi05172_g2207 [Venturia inaequalis]